MDMIGIIYISETLINKLGIPDQYAIRVRVGSLEVLSKLVVKNIKRKTFMLSPELSRALLLKKRKPLKLRYDSANNSIHLGPTIGILASSIPHKSGYEATSTQAELIYLSKLSKTLNAQVYVFTPTSINWSNLTTRGYVYVTTGTEKGGWRSSTYPLPDVVYDRITTRTSESKSKIKETKKRLMDLPHLRYFNPSFLNKWKVYETLIVNPRLRQHIPETRQLTVSNFKDLLSKYKTVYVKPSNGSLGKGIIRVSKENGGSGYLVYKAGRIKGHAESEEDFMNKTKKIRAGRPYIVQQGIDLATYNKSAFDVRIIYQKNANGEWQISKKFVRVAPRGSTISNLSSGGRAVTVRKVFKVLYRKADVIEQRNSQLKELCKIVAETLENKCNGIFGELGLDIGMDRNGVPWLIEVNSKPRKTTETELSATIVRNTFRRPLEYGFYLAGF
ncbi:MAG: YheC/YheD family protein [Syntrophomonadaceae bacterium]|jgi:glutathione synthase/RimK-type ligase-like ATP-grasp enzyme